MIEWVQAGAAIFLFFIAVYLLYLAIVIWFVPEERYQEYRRGLGGWSGLFWGDNTAIREEGRCEGMVVTKDGKLKRKASYSRSAIGRLFR
jgi:hypothetical protein